MIRTLVTFAVTLGIALPLAAAEAEVTATFVVDEASDAVIKWIEANPDALHKAAGLTILERNGKQVKVRKRTLRGLFIFTLAESKDTSDKGTKAITKLVKSHRGGIVEQYSEILVKSASEKAEIVITMRAKVEKQSVKKFHVKSDLKKSVKNIRKLLSKQFGKSDD